MSFSWLRLVLSLHSLSVLSQYITCTSFRKCPSILVGSHDVLIVYSTNQTTLESLSPFLLLRYLAPLPVSLRLSDPPMEHELSFNQRNIVRDAHRSLKLYDIGWRRNWAQVFGWSKPRGWVYRLTYGGARLVGVGYHPRCHSCRLAILSMLISALQQRGRTILPSQSPCRGEAIETCGKACNC